MSVRNYKPSSTDFHRWIHEEIWYDGHSRTTRYEYLSEFTEDLRRWIRSYGYVLNSQWSLKAVAHWMYSVAVIGKASDYLNHQRLRYPEPDHRNWQEDYDYFHATVTLSDIENFLWKWRFCEDFDLDSRMGKLILCELGNLLYTYVDLEVSENGKKIAEFMESSSSDSDNEPVKRAVKKGPSDAYLQEMKEGSHGGGVWSKV